MNIETYFPGNCKFCVIYNLGSAENIGPADNFFHFLYKIRKTYGRNSEEVILCTTNEEQHQERAWLEEAGFQTHHIEDSQFQMHTIVKANLRRTFRKHEQELDKCSRLANRRKFR